ncbi:MAG: response regulator [Actinomycetales bacterium]|jgi:two-component system, OmpR family, response regulator|nr:response regulator transcription factor [Actinomycetota bacterium]NCG02737.1 response regulator [Actinomycetales bacterium]MBT5182054.1 response regulator transcription factor [Actinomycetota bacterium]MBT5501773.1 response regulator transcription factor [Actinomycetota bacterium]MBT5806486.1 response regulator transcription factor [Actinomycetota bacterium]
MRVLVVEDERPISDLIGVYLAREGFEVQSRYDGESGLSTAQIESFDLIILDVGLSKIDGIEICRRLRAANDWTPIVFCTARDDEVDRVLGLELGADDYLTKPFSPRELVARVKAIVRRSAHQVNSGESLEADGVSVNLRTRRASHNGSSLVLTATEFDLMTYLMARPGRVIERSELLENVWGYSEALGTRTVDVHIAQIRTKLGPNASIRTVRGVGYSWEAPTHDDA